MSYVIQDTTEQVVIRGADNPTVITTGSPQQVSLTTTAATSATGPPGPPGPQGPPGQPRWRGTGAPGTIIGAEPGDVYLDESTGTLYTLG